MEKINLKKDEDNSNAPESEQLNLFSNISNELSIVKMKFGEVQHLDWKELFSGYNELYAITYSSGIGFVSQLLKLFDKAEIIFGCEQVMSYSLQTIMAFQYKIIDELRKAEKQKHIDLVTKIKDGSLIMRVAREKLSHEKIYLLKANDGRKRVIMGSANMSYSAFNGKQRENICFLDDEDAYEWYYSVYESLKEESTDEIENQALSISDIAENAEDLPISQTIKQKKIFAIQQNTNTEDQFSIQFALDVKNLVAQYRPASPKIDKDGKIRITPETLKIVKKQMVNISNVEKETKKEYPKLTISFENKSAELNGKILDLSPSKEAIAKDVKLFIKYMDGFETFHGDFKTMQKRYYSFANWFFCSPFMGIMRETATLNNKQILPYPVFGLVYGQSKGGKTSFLTTLLKMMIGQKTKLPAPDFTRSSIEALRRTVQGSPIIVDDLTNDRFTQHAIETIKNDDFGIDEHIVNYPAVVISANTDVKAVSQEIMRRTVICRIQLGKTNTEVMKSNIVRSVQTEIGTSFYREYIRRMLEKMPELINALKDQSEENVPDILAVSSYVLKEIIEENINKVKPFYVKELNMDDYFGDEITGEQTIELIREAWKTNQKSFQIKRRLNQLCYDAKETWEADRMVKELPETLEPHRSREMVVMKLDVARKFFGINFRKGII